MTFFSIYTTDSLDSVEKKINYKSRDCLKGIKWRNISGPADVRWYAGKTA